MNYYFCPAFTVDEFKLAIEKNLDIRNYSVNPNANGHCVALESNEGLRGIFIWLRSAEVSRQNIGTLVHESIHANNLMFDWAGIKLDTINDEAQAYYTGWIFNQCMKAWEQHGED